MGAEEILIIILAVTLTVFLIVSIILTVILIKLTRSLKRVADKAEGLVGNVESAAAAFSGVAGKVATGKFLVNVADLVMNRKKGKK